MSDINLGSLIKSNGDRPERDAVHFAIAPVVCDEILMPGQHIGLVKGSMVKVEPSKKPIGIVDPFLTKPIPAGSIFWMMLYQKTVTGMRHAWEHPAFPVSVPEPIVAIVKPVEDHRKNWLEEQAKARANIEDIAGTIGVDYDELMEGAKNYLLHEDYMVDGGRFEGVSVGDDFWDSYEIVIGKKVLQDKRGSFFSCSC